VTAAINQHYVAEPGQAAPITVAEYLRAAPIVHEYLAHAPYGTDSRPIGTPQDWAAVDAAKKQTNVRRDQLIRSGVNPTTADTQAKVDALKSLTNTVQRTLYVNGASLVNPQRKLMALKYGTLLSRFSGSAADYTQESASEYRNFPFGP
jgi:hypothetical protein